MFKIRHKVCPINQDNFNGINKQNALCEKAQSQCSVTQKGWYFRDDFAESILSFLLHSLHSVAVKLFLSLSNRLVYETFKEYFGDKKPNFNYKSANLGVSGSH